MPKMTSLELCYTLTMQEHYWQTWARKLQRWGLIEPAIVFLEVTGPIGLIMAQFCYLSQPFLHPDSKIQAEFLAHILEDRHESREFVNYLKEER